MVPWTDLAPLTSNDRHILSEAVVFISRIRLKGNGPASRSHLQYSVRLFNVTHVALLTQGALLSTHCRAARHKRQMVRKWRICQTLLPSSPLVWLSVPAPSLCYQLYCTLSYHRIIRSNDTRFQHCCGHRKNYIAQQLVFLSTFLHLCMSVTAQLHKWQSMMLICSGCLLFCINKTLKAVKAGVRCWHMTQLLSL